MCRRWRWSSARRRARSPRVRRRTPNTPSLPASPSSNDDPRLLPRGDGRARMSNGVLTHEGSGLAVGTAEPRSEPRAAEQPARLARNVTALVGGQLVTWTMTLLWTLVVPRLLGPAGLGMVVSAMSVSGVLAIVLGLGTRNYLVREIVIDRLAAPRL